MMAMEGIRLPHLRHFPQRGLKDPMRCLTCAGASFNVHTTQVSLPLHLSMHCTARLSTRRERRKGLEQFEIISLTCACCFEQQQPVWLKHFLLMLIYAYGKTSGFHTDRCLRAQLGQATQMLKVLSLKDLLHRDAASLVMHGVTEESFI